MYLLQRPLVIFLGTEGMLLYNTMFNQKEANKHWIGSTTKGEHWSKCQAIFKARHISEPKWLSWRFFQVESIDRGWEGEDYSSLIR